MDGQVLHDEGELRAQVLQIVHEEGRHRLEGLQGLRPVELVRQAQAQQARCGLVGNRLEQLLVLRREGRVPVAPAQGHDADRPRRCAQGDGISDARLLQCGRMAFPEVRDPFFSRSAEIHRHLAIPEGEKQLRPVLARQLHRPGPLLRKGCGGDKHKAVPALLRNPQADGQTIEGLRNHVHHRGTQVLRCRESGRRLRELGPDLPVVVQRPLEQAAHEVLPFHPHASGQQERTQAHDRDKKQERRHRQAPASDPDLRQPGKQAYADEVGADEDDRHRVVKEGVRQVDVDLHFAVPKGGHRDEGIGHEEHCRIQGEVVRPDLVVEDGQAAVVDAHPEEGADADDHELDLPSLAARRVPQGLLQVHHHEDRAGDDGQRPDVARPSQGQVPPRSRLHKGRARVPVAPQEYGESRGDGPHGDHQIDPPGEDLAVVDPSVGEAEEQPAARQQRRNDRLGPIPQEKLLGIRRPQGHGRQRRLDDEQGHARRKKARHDAFRVPRDDVDSQRSRYRRRQVCQQYADIHHYSLRRTIGGI